jgi:hypothetical protein
MVKPARRMIVKVSVSIMILVVFTPTPSSESFTLCKQRFD